MQEQIKSIKQNNYSISFIFSVLLHTILFLVSAFLLNLQVNKPVVNSVFLSYLESDIPKQQTDEANIDKTNEIKSENLSAEEITDYYSFSKSEFDTSDINQIYKESTLNVSVRFPNGWTYLDQNVKNKLDGVTFWSLQKNNETPPYVQLDVQDKYIFNPSRFEFKMDHNGNTYYYNQPSEMEGYITQIIYIRTDTDEDYSLKLMVKGKETFKSFQPVFFNMAKSLEFGNSFF